MLGLGARDEGYGLTVPKYYSGYRNPVTAPHMANLYADINKCLIHQTGPAVTQIAQSSVGDIVEDPKHNYKRRLCPNTKILVLQHRRLIIRGIQPTRITIRNIASVGIPNWFTDIDHVFTVTLADIPELTETDRYN